MVEHLRSKCEVLSSNPRTISTKKKEREIETERDRKREREREKTTYFHPTHTRLYDRHHQGTGLTHGA
jgi:hypothetical protein